MARLITRANSDYCMCCGTEGLILCDRCTIDCVAGPHRTATNADELDLFYIYAFQGVDWETGEVVDLARATRT